MTNYRPLFYSIGIIFFLAIAVNLVVAPFVDVSTANPESFMVTSGIHNFIYDIIVETSFFSSFNFDLDFLGNIFGLDLSITIPFPTLNIFAFLPSGARNFIGDQITLITYIPDMVLIPIAVLSILGIIWGVVKLILA